MSIIQVNVLMNVVGKFVDYVCTFLQDDQKPRLWGTNGSMIFTSFLSFKVLDQLENLTPVWKSVEIELSSLSILNSLERLNFVKCLHTKIFYSVIYI